MTLPSPRPAPFSRAFSFAVLALALALTLGGVLFWTSPVQAQAATVLVKNTGQTASTVTLAPDSTNLRDARAFTTGSHVCGYTLSSIGISFDAIADPSTAESELTVTLNEEGCDGNPGTLLCTLSDPATFTASIVNAFDAPTTGTECPTLAASPTYFVVVERANSNTDAISYQTTLSNDEYSGGADGWSIGDATYFRGPSGPDRLKVDIRLSSRCITYTRSPRPVILAGLVMSGSASSVPAPSFLACNGWPSWNLSGLAVRSYGATLVGLLKFWTQIVSPGCVRI